LAHVPAPHKSGLRLAAERDVLAGDCNATRLIGYGTRGSAGAPTVVRFTCFENRLPHSMRQRIMIGIGLRRTDRRSTTFKLLRGGRSGPPGELPRPGAQHHAEAATNRKVL